MAGAKRKLAAILAADVAGYGRLMGDDEPATVDMLRIRRDVFRKHISDRDGRLVDMAGDSVLATFDSVVEAVQCAIDVQGDIERLNADLAEARRMRFRIGVNLGDIIVSDDGTIYGDGVNVAARLEALAKPGTICVSQSCHMQAAGKVDAVFTDLGTHQVKNISDPVKAYSVEGVRAAATAESESVRVPADKPSIAVLPFANMSGEPAQEYFADGVTEDIITALSRFRSLIVIARNSTFVYKDRSVNVGDVGLELGVAYVVEGSIRKAGDRMRVTAQLVEAQTGKHLWADRYDRSLEDVFNLQDDVTESIVSTLTVHLEDAERARSNRSDPNDLSAYDWCLRGKSLFYKGSKKDLLEARTFFERAIEIDPTYAAAYIELGETYFVEARSAWTTSPEAAFVKLFELARKAVELDPHDSRAHLALAFAHFAVRGDFELAGMQIEEALRLNPNDFDNHCFKGWLSTCKGELNEAVACSNEALRRSPLVPDECLQTRIAAEYLRGNYDDAVKAFSRMIRPDAIAAAWVAAAYAQLSRIREAREKLDDFLRGCGGPDAAAPNDERQWREFWAAAFPSIDPAARDHLHEGLRKAGLQI